MTVLAYPDGILYNSVAAVLASAKKGDFVKVDNVTVFGLTSDSYIFGDATGNLAVYLGSSPVGKVEVGKVYDIYGLFDVYNGSAQLNSLTDATMPAVATLSDGAVTVLTPTIVTDIPAFISATAPTYDANNLYSYQYIEITAKVRVQGDGNYETFLVNADYSGGNINSDPNSPYTDNAIMIYYKSNLAALKAFDNKVVTFKAFMYTYRNDRNIHTLIFMGEAADISLGMTEPFIPELGLIISKYFEGTDETKIIELYNTTNASINLANFSLTIYKRVFTETVKTTIPLTGIIDSHETFIVAGPYSQAVIIALADMTSSDLIYDGKEAIALTYYNDVDTDVLGVIGSGLTYANNRTLVRDISVTEATTNFDIKLWGTYVVDNFSMFGSHPVAYPTEFLLGTQYLTLDYFTEKGGVAKVEFIYNNDGDTAYFIPGFEGNDRVRFVGIDTTETGSGTLATQAKKLCDKLIRKRN